MRFFVPYRLLLLWLFGVLFTCADLKSQDIHTVDSLKHLLNTNLNDTSRCRVYLKLARQYWDVSPDTILTLKNQKLSIAYARKALVIAENANFTMGLAEAYYIQGYVHFDQHKHPEALSLLKKALKLYTDARSEADMSNLNFLIGNVYFDISDYENALPFYQECLQMDLKRGDSAEAAGVYSNIANIYFYSGNYKDAIAYLKKAIKINEATGNKGWLAVNHILIANSLKTNGDYLNAHREFTKASQLFQEVNDVGRYALALVELASNLNELKNYKAAMDSSYKALHIYRSLHDRNGMAYSFNILGLTYTRLRNFKMAETYLDSCYQLSLNLGDRAMRNVYLRLYQLDSARDDGASAFLHYMKFIEIRDVLDSKEKKQAINNLKMKFEYSLKEEQEALVLQKKEEEERNIRFTLLIGIFLLLLFAFILYNRYRMKQKANVLLAEQKARSDELLLNILPESVAEELKTTGNTKARRFDEISVMFTDFKGFTEISELMSPEELVEEIHTCFKAFDQIIERYGLEKIKTIGDAYMCAGGLPNFNANHAINLVKAALEINDFMKTHADIQRRNLNPVFEIRIGIHTGPVVAGVVGVKKFAYDIWGDTVNTASRMESSAETGKVNISESTYELVKDHFNFTPRGLIQAKNKGEMNMYYVEGLK